MHHMPKMFSRRNTLLKWWLSLGRGAGVGAEAPLFTQYPPDHLNFTAPHIPCLQEQQEGCATHRRHKVLSLARR